MEKITVGDIVIDVTRKRIKNMYLRVQPNGNVVMSAPLQMKERDMRRFATSQYSWIQKHLAVFATYPVQEPLQFLSGEIHYLWGEAYTLEVTSAKINAVTLLGDKIILQVRSRMDSAQREALLDEWYRTQLEAALPPVIRRCENIIGVHANEWRTKKMKTRWGTCNVLRKRIWINVQLAKKTPDCLDYIVTHELTHLLEKSHNAVFKAYMDQFYPGWREVRKSLNMQAN